MKNVVNKIKFTLGGFILAVFVVGCGQPEVYVNPEFQGAPKWVQNPVVEGKISELGSAPKNTMNNFGFQRELAMANGRNNLAKRLEINVKSMFKTYASQTTANGGTMDMTAESVSKQITKQSLNGTYQHDAWTSKSGTLYILMAIDTDSVAKLVEENAKTSFGNDEAAYQRVLAAKAQGELNKELEK